ncbi:ABC transporter ATP-binding protein [Clostridium sporogenes]|uniref:ABC transporter ATP-binding protein n=1 Tax=Clostridium sporogenes TaxID=1509 RepID=UPI0006B297AC|nr:ABC transporter ATP-binding protein [Clostridium sporogenes]KOY65402.1 hypothetical protein AN649_13050 [Clostridium sporogenes]MDS1006669.1 ABC transporter ATP-binding protein [Clostridium sporogenes]
MEENIIKIRNLSKKKDSKYLLSDINVTVNKGELVVLLGKNGAGKTTLIRCLIGLSKIDSGEIEVNGLEWNRKNDQKIKSIISYIPDKVNFDYNLTVEQNLIYHASFYGISSKDAKEKINELLGYFNLSDKKDSNINELSFGMQKKALIVRGLLSDPEIIIFDEPTIGLDPKAEKDLLTHILKLKDKGITVLLSTQSLKVANHSDKVIFIEKGMAKEINNIDSIIDLNKETLKVSINSIDESIKKLLINKFKENDSIYSFDVQNNVINIELNNTKESLLECISILLESELKIYSIEFGNSSYMSFYE